MMRNLYSYEGLLADALKKIADYGSKGTDSHTLFSTYPTDTNDGPVEEVFASQSRLLPFEGLKKKIRKDAEECEATF